MGGSYHVAEGCKAEPVGQDHTRDTHFQGPSKPTSNARPRTSQRDQATDYTRCVFVL